MTLKDKEKSLLKKIENKDLERLVRHFRLEKSVDVELEGEVYKDTKAVTFIVLLKEDDEEVENDYFEINGDADMNRFIEKYRYDSSVEGIGYAICSDDDNFNKTKGRLIATGRALKGQKKI